MRVVDPFSGEPMVRQLLGKLWTPDFSCTRFVTVALDLPYIFGGRFGAILARSHKSWHKVRPGDILVWRARRSRRSAHLPTHAALYVNERTLLHCGNNGPPDPTPMCVCYTTLLAPGAPWIEVREGKPLF